MLGITTGRKNLAPKLKKIGKIEELTLMAEETKCRFFNLHFGKEYKEEIIIHKDELTEKM
jgi:hypothetical protein